MYFFFQDLELCDRETEVLGVGLSETGQWELPGDHPESPDQAHIFTIKICQKS